MASRIQAKSLAVVPAPDISRELPEAAVTGSGAGVPAVAAGECGKSGAGAPFFAVGSDGFADAVTSGGFAKVDEADKAGGFATTGGSGREGGTGRTDAPVFPDGSAAATTAGGTGRGSIRAGGRRVRSITCGPDLGGPESAATNAAPTKRCRRTEAPAPPHAVPPVQPRGTGMLSCRLINALDAQAICETPH
jgi:hypothetical protein